MALDPSKGYRALRDGRHSQDWAEYFVTFCTHERATGLHRVEVASIITREIRQMETDAVWAMRCFIIMPDHLHLYFQLGQTLSLGKAVARLKSKAKAALNAHSLDWQAGYFEHRLRPKEDILPIFLYIYLNPYQAGLIQADKTWPWFVCGNEDKAWFTEYLDHGLPEPTWLQGLP